MRFIRIIVICVSLAVVAGCSNKTGSATTFDGQRSYDLLKKQCDIGPRYSGTPGQKAMVEFMRSDLSKFADEVSISTFTVGMDGKKMPFTNVYAVFNPGAKKFVLLCAHWDTRPTADMEIDAAKQKKPILGANDGASGVAVLLELARMFKTEKPPVGVVMAFFDGEDYGPGLDRMFLGSKYFAEHYKTEVRPGGKEISYQYGILLDMVGDKDLGIGIERFSLNAAPKVVEKVWSTANRLGYAKEFVQEPRYSVSDDHLPLLSAGIKCIDIIDFDYAPWHTLDDTPEQCSPKSLKTVGDVVSTVVYAEGI